MMTSAVLYTNACGLIASIDYFNCGEGMKQRLEGPLNKPHLLKYLMPDYSATNLIELCPHIILMCVYAYN